MRPQGINSRLVMCTLGRHAPQSRGSAPHLYRDSKNRHTGSTIPPPGSCSSTTHQGLRWLLQCPAHRGIRGTRGTRGTALRCADLFVHQGPPSSLSCCHQQRQQRHRQRYQQHTPKKAWCQAPCCWYPREPLSQKGPPAACGGATSLLLRMVLGNAPGQLALVGNKISEDS